MDRFSFRNWLLRPASFSSRKLLARNAIHLRLEELENRLAPATTLSIADGSAIEPAPHGTVNMNFTVTRTGDLTSQLTVGYKTVPGTAKPTIDFTPQTGTTTFAAGAATATISIPIFGNGVFDNPSLSFSVQLTGIVNAVGAPVSFAKGQTFSTGSKPTFVTVADVNGDGKPDLIVGFGGANTISVLLNTTAPGAPSPSFAAQQAFTVGTTPQSVKVVDLNGDGKPDLVAANAGDSTVSVLVNTTAPGQSTLSFATQQTFATGADPVFVTAADINKDGTPDLVVANSGDNTVSVLLNTTAPGAATVSFATQQTFTTATSPVALAVGDVNGDGKPDVAAVCAGANTVSVLLNTTAPGATTASFAGQQTFATGTKPQSLAMGDLNGDGVPDLAVANNGDGTVSVLLNTTAPGAATPSFAAQQTFTVGSNPSSVVIGDANGDGKRDLIAANSGDNTVSVLLNTAPPGAATESFATQQTFATGTGPAFVALGDTNGDGLPDLVAANQGDSTVSVLLSTMVPGAATITPNFSSASTSAVGAGPFAVAVGDVNGDGKPDIVVANSVDYTLSVLLNTTAPGAVTPSFATPQVFKTGSYPVGVALADINGDGMPDVILANVGDNTVSVLLNTTAPGATTAAFADQQTFATGSYPVAVAVGDFNGDGKPDLAVVNEGDSTVSVLLNTTAAGATTASFSAEQPFPTGSGPIAVTVGDLNGDGMPDVIVANGGSNSVSVLLNTTQPGGSAASFAAQKSFNTGAYPVGVAVGDINGDGTPDIVVANSGTHFNPQHSVSVLLNTTAPGATTASFAAQKTFATGAESCSVVLSDVNGDGKADLVVANQAERTVSVLINTTAPGAATPSFTPHQTFTTGNEPISVALADMNGDGLPDIVVANYADNTVSVLTNSPAAITRDTATGTITESDTGPSTGGVSYFKISTPSGTQTTGTPFAITVTAVDALGNTFPNYTGKVHFTSSDQSAVLQPDSTLTNGVGMFNVTLNTAGSQTITATDDAGTLPIITGTSSALTTRGLTVASLTPTATGFAVTFSKPIVATDVSLWGGTQANPVQDVTVVGANSGLAVNGSFIVDPSGMSATFKASSVWLALFESSSVLTNDTYKVTLVSGTGTGATAHGFFDALGAGLDGADNGGHADFTTSFTTANDGKPALSMPDFARGPDGASTIQVPNDSAKGIPVTLSNVPAAAGVTDVAFTLSYNPTLFVPTAGGTGDSTGTGSTFVMGTPTTADATHATVTFTWHNSTAQSGTVVLGDILANVPNSAANQYKAKQLLGLGTITVNGAAFSGAAANSLDINAYLGDVTGDGQITALDVATAGNVASGNSTSPIGLAAFPLVDPAAVGDIAGDGSIDATAVSDLAAFTSNLHPPQIPAPPTGLTITPGGPDPTLSLGEVGRIDSSTNNAIVSVPVILDHPHPDGSAGMEEAILALTYDPSELTVSPADITLGSIPGQGSGWRLISMVDQATGQIGIDLYSTTAITATQAGSLVNIAFHVTPNTQVAATAVQLVSSVSPGGHWFSTEVADVQGQLTLSPGMDRLVIQTASQPALPVVAAAESTNPGPGIAARDHQDEAAATVFSEVETAGPIILLGNGPLAAETDAFTVPTSLLPSGALAFQTNATTIADGKLRSGPLASPPLVDRSSSVISVFQVENDTERSDPVLAATLGTSLFDYQATDQAPDSDQVARDALFADLANGTIDFGDF
jgi:hypothetical protein